MSPSLFPGLPVPAMPNITINDITYRWPERPVVVICVDGCDPEYLERGFQDGILPHLAQLKQGGFYEIAHSAMPSFTNPNNVSIVTGLPPSEHGISGNYFLDTQRGVEVMMDDPRLLRAETILAGFASRGARVAAISAKDKLCRLLAAGRVDSRFVCFSAECADLCTHSQHGVEGVLELVERALPDVYSADLSLFVLDAGIRLLERERYDLVYLSLSDYVQHKFAPGSFQSNRFYRQLDERIGELAKLDIVLGIVADHGMSDKSRDDGSPQVVYLQDELQRAFGHDQAKVILPITDPYVVHHGALGGFARVYCGVLPVPTVLDFIRQLPGIDGAWPRDEACQRFSLPADREADLVVLSDPHFAIGKRCGEHDLSALGSYRLRSHGGLSEQRVPFLLSHPLTSTYSARIGHTPLNNYDIFDFAINGTRSNKRKTPAP